MKKYAERSEAKKKTIKIKRGPKKLNFGASKPGVRGGPGPLGPPLDPQVGLNKGASQYLSGLRSLLSLLLYGKLSR